MKNIAILASGSGSNAQNIAEYFKFNQEIAINCILTNKKDAYVLQRAKTLNIPSKVFNRSEFYDSAQVLDFLKEKQTDFIVLAGFLWLVPNNIIKAFPNKIINIHPALLPKYGGKGMFGNHVHQAVVDNNEIESGITIHYVNEQYDDGQIIFQAKCNVSKNDSANDVANKVHQLEYDHFPKVIEEVLSKI